jgi:hypothetical protein
MTTPATPSNEKPAGDDRNLVAVDENYKALTFEDTVNQIWRRNRNLVWGLLILVTAVIVGKGGWEYMQRQRELGVESDYAAATTSAQLKTFAAAHSGHTLAGVAHLRIADEAYTAGKSADAIAAYDQAAASLKTGPLAARAKIGRAMAKVQSGKAAEGSTDLKQVAADTTQLNSVRAEATYHLASLAAEGANAAEVIKYSEELEKLAPNTPWAQRAAMLRASLPVTATPMITTPAASSAPAPAAKKDEPKGPEVQLKLPGGK